MIRVQRPPDVRAFLREAGPFLAKREAEHNLVFGICSQLVLDPMRSGELAPYFAIIEDDGRIVGAAVRTPPHNLVLSEIDELDAIEPLVLDIREAFAELPGVLGPGEAASTFVRSWCDREGRTAAITRQSRIYQASRATPPNGVAGAMRPYAEDDHDLTIGWLDAFTLEALPEEAAHGSSERELQRRLTDPDGGMRIWEIGGRSVSLAGFGSPTPSGIRVGPVYTPPEARGNGYASALVGQMTAELLHGGHRFCFLFTDVANPTSNGVYQRIGYEGVADVDQYVFA